MALLLGAGLKHPVLAALAGAVWVVSSYYYIQVCKSGQLCRVLRLLRCWPTHTCVYCVCVCVRVALTNK